MLLNKLQFSFSFLDHFLGNLCPGSRRRLPTRKRPDCAGGISQGLFFKASYAFARLQHTLVELLQLIAELILLGLFSKCSKNRW